MGIAILSCLYVLPTMNRHDAQIFTLSTYFHPDCTGR